METELQRLEVSRSMFKSSSNVSNTNDHDLKYTSLKDILSALDSPTAGNSSAFAAVHDFNSSSISIRNQLVKHAASVYLQSAAILAARDQNCCTRQEQHPRRNRAALCSGWRGCVEVCVGFVARSVRRVLACVASQIVRVRSRPSHE